MKTKFVPHVRVIRKPDSDRWLVQTRYTRHGPLFVQDRPTEDDALSLASLIRQDLNKNACRLKP